MEYIWCWNPSHFPVCEQNMFSRDDPVFSILSGSETCSEISVKSTNKYSTPHPVINSSENNPPAMVKRLPRRTEMVLNLAGGWRKKIYKSRKRWSVLLLAPDSTVLRDDGELTKYLRLKKMKKNENVLNFHLPPLTEQVKELDSSIIISTIFLY